MDREEIYADIKEHFANDSQVVVSSGKGAQGIKYKGKMFIMFYKGDLVIKLSPDRIKELIEVGDGLQFDPGTGKPMKDRLLLPLNKKHLWIPLSDESKEYILGS